ncbi:MAG: heavy metal translocating P-type ATPase [Pirellula sp.]
MSKSFSSGTPPNLELSVHGMTCAACVGRVERAIRKVPGVRSANVNLATERAHVELDNYSDKSIEEVTRAIRDSGYEAHIISNADDVTKIDRSKTSSTTEKIHLWIAWGFAVPIFMISMAPMLVPSLMTLMMGVMPMEHWNLLLWFLATPVQFIPGLKFYKHAYASIQQRSPDMNFLVATGTTAAYGFSSLVTFFPNWLSEEANHVYFESSAVVIAFVLLGKYLEERSKRETRNALQALVRLQPRIAHRLSSAPSLKALPLAFPALEDIDVHQLQLGDIIQVRPGESIPIDATVESGTSFVDESMITGEPIPVAKSQSMPVIGGTVNGNGTLVARVTAIGNETVLARITSLVMEAQSSKPPIQLTVDRVVNWFAPAVIVIAMITAIGWFLGSAEHRVENALVHSVAVLIVACPCAMGLATPISMMVGSGRGAELGLLFRSGTSLQNLSSVQIALFDKTGTLTQGHPELTDIKILDQDLEGEILALASLAAQSSDHPISKAIVAAAIERSENHPQRDKWVVVGSQAVPGRGVEAKLSDGRTVFLGSYSWMMELEKNSPESDHLNDEIQNQGKSCSWVAMDARILGVLLVSDPIKPEAAEAIQKIVRLGIVPTIVSGDHRVAVQQVASDLGIKDWFAETMPSQKSDRINTLQASGKQVAFIGDGINDAPAIASANVGIAIGTGTEVAASAADVVLISGNLTLVPTAIRLAKAVLANIHQNLFWAFAYNIILIPVAAGILTPITGWSLTPMLAAAAMSLSSIFVVGNAWRLHRFR